MPIVQEQIHTAFEDEFSRLNRDGLDKLMALPLDHLLYRLYRAGYLRGHGDRSRDAANDERATASWWSKAAPVSRAGTGR